MGLSNIEVKRMNRNGILRYMLQEEKASKNTIAAALALSIPTVAQCLKELQSMGLIEEEGAMESIGGRKPMAYRAVKNAKVALGLDITRNHVNLVIVNLAMQPVYSKRVHIKVTGDQKFYDQLKEIIYETIEKSEIEIERFLGMVVSLPAIIDETGTRIYGMHEQLKLSYDFYNIIKGWVPFPVQLGNDADCAGRGEIPLRKEWKDWVYFFVSPSVGGSIIINGNTFYGENRRAGEFGHMILVPDGKKCYCGRLGCVNCYCNTENLSEYTDGDLQKFFEKLEEGDKECIKIWDEYLDNLSKAVHNLLSSFDLKIVIGGYIGQYIGKYMNELISRVQKMDDYLTDSEFIQPALLKYEASAVGAAMVLTERYISEI